MLSFLWIFVDAWRIGSTLFAVLCCLYALSRVRLRQGGFELQSCSSNCEDSGQNGGGWYPDWERVFGYRYIPLTDTQCIAPINCDPNDSTNRQILAEVARVFDPLLLYLPVSLRDRILSGELWKRDLGWDEQVPTEFSSTWKSLLSDFSVLATISLPQKTFSENGAGDLVPLLRCITGDICVRCICGAESPVLPGFSKG